MAPLDIKDIQEWLLAQKCMAGDLESHKELRKRIPRVLRAKLFQWGATQTEADDIAADLSSDCVATLRDGASLLRKYDGKGALDGWLLKTAFHRFLTLRRTQKFEMRFNSDGTHRSATLEIVPLLERRPPEEVLVNIIRTSLSKAFSLCSAEERLMLRLVYCEGVTQRELGRMWAWHECKVSRRLSKALDRIKSETLRDITLADPSVRITWEDFLELGDTVRLQLV